MDKKDKIILQQLDVIRSMTENNMKRMNSDFWGTPFENVTGSAPKSPAPAGSSSNGGSALRRRKRRPLPPPPSPATKSPPRRSCRRRRRSRICWRSWTATSDWVW